MNYTIFVPRWYKPTSYHSKQQCPAVSTDQNSIDFQNAGWL